MLIAKLLLFLPLIAALPAPDISNNPRAVSSRATEKSSKPVDSKKGKAKVDDSDSDDDSDDDGPKKGPAGFQSIKPITVDLSKLSKGEGGAAFVKDQEKKKSRLDSQDDESVSGGFWGKNVGMDESDDVVLESKKGTNGKLPEVPQGSESESDTKEGDTKKSKGSKEGEKSSSNAAGKKPSRSLIARAVQNPKRLANVEACLKDASSARKDSNGKTRKVRYITEKNDPKDYPKWSSPYNQRLRNQVTADVIVVAYGSRDVRNAVKCAAKYDMPIQPRGGGHAYSAFSSMTLKGGGMVIDLQNMDQIGASSDWKMMTAAGGTRLGNLALAALQGGRAIPHGDCPTVGLAGHSLHGGFGYTSRMWGLSTDAIVGLDVVTDDGKEVYCDADSDPDLFWAMKGAGDSFGIATKFYLQTQPAPRVVYHFNYDYNFLWDKKNKIDAKEIPGYLGAIWSNVQYCVRDAGNGSPNYGLTIRTAYQQFRVAGYIYGDLNQDRNSDILSCLDQRLARRPQIDKLTFSGALATIGGSVSLQQPADANRVKSNFFAKSLMVPTENTFTASSMMRYFRAVHGKASNFGNTFVITFRLMGGKSSTINTKERRNSGAVSYRDSLWIVQHDGQTSKKSNEMMDWIEDLHELLAKQGGDKDNTWGSFGPFADPSMKQSESHKAYFSTSAYKKLQEYKRKWDPKEIFENRQSVEPAKK